MLACGGLPDRAGRVKLRWMADDNAKVEGSDVDPEEAIAAALAPWHLETADAPEIAEFFHRSYCELAEDFEVEVEELGGEWDEVPESYRLLVTEVIERVLQRLRDASA